MTDAPDMEPTELDELIAATKALLDFPGGAYAPALENRAKRAMDAALAARSAPEAGKAVTQLGGAPDDLHNLIKVVFADMTIDRMNEVCKEVIARRNPSLAHPSPGGWQDPDDCELEGN